MRVDAVQNKIEELHQYVRHVFTLFVNWFIFFVTVNYATMGWLTKPDGNKGQDLGILYVVVALFISQNLLGIVACNEIYKYLTTVDCKISDLGNIASTLDEIRNGEEIYSSSVPLATYKKIIILAKLALFIIAIAWLSVLIAKKYIK